ncbi:MAG: TonB-dependent receptor [Woeseiaceae bacterium]|jgi:TonB-dependent receptor
MQTNFMKSPVAVGVALALGAAGPSQVIAQEDDSDQIEEIIVTAIRSSLQSAQALKENSDTFVDAVTASDIGALPDRSVAEALQRVPGVSIGRFKKTTDPDRFSVEGADVLIRGLPFVRSELNGRDVFSATGGTVLSFNDVSPELLGGVMVYKNVTADMIDGGIAGTVDLVTRKPLDTDGLKLAGSAEMNYGDIAEEASPTFSFLGSNKWETSGGAFGLQLGYAQSELNTRSYASQVTDPCYRDPDTLELQPDFGGTPCIRAQVPNDANGFNDGTLSPEEFAQATEGAVIVPKGAGVRTTGYEREREAFSLVGQWESNDGELLVTAEYLRAEAELFVDEASMLAQVNNPNLYPRPAFGTDWAFSNNGTFETGTLSQNQWRGWYNCQPSNYDWSGPQQDVGSLDKPEEVPPDFPWEDAFGVTPEYIASQPCNVMVGLPTELLRFQRKDESLTEDVSLALSWNPTDKLSLNVEAQYMESERSEIGIIGANQTQADVFVDLKGETPDVRFQTPGTTDGSSDPDYFTNPDRTYMWFLLDSQIENEADMTTLRADLDYYFGEDGFIRQVKFGARWSDRNRITRDNNFQNWGNLSAPWGTDLPSGSARYASEPTIPSSYNNVYNPFRDFQRGETSVPTPGGAAIYWGGPNLLQEYLSGATEEQAGNVTALSPYLDFVHWGPVYNRSGVIEGTPFTPGEISDVSQQTQAAYIRVDFGVDGETPISGNIGVRYVKTNIESDGELQFPLSPPPNDDLCANPPPAGPPGYCFLSDARRAEFDSAYTGELITDNADIDFDHWLPSLNVKIGVTDNFIIRAAASKGISRPDLALFATGGLIGDNTSNLQASGTLETGPLFIVETGNRLLEPVTAWSYDLSAEWYFSDIGALTVSLFQKDFEDLITGGATVRDLTSDTGNTSAVVEVRGSTNLEDATIQGFELAYQQTFDFLPAPFNALGAQATYTYVDGGDLKNRTDNELQRSPFTAGLPLAGLSEDTVNLVAFYETEAWSARLAYNWRSEFLLTDRDDIYPYNPIWGEDTGQLDGSIFYNFINLDMVSNLRVGLQVVNILDEVTKTSSVYNYEGSRFPRTAFRNDRRYTLAVRFDF